MGRGLGVAGAVVLGVMAAASAGAESFDLVTVGARAEGMGGAGIASAEGTSAVFHNPALLALEASPEVVVAGRRLEDRAGGSGAETFSQDALHLAGGVLPLGRGWVAGLAWQRPLELVTHYRGRDVDGGVVSISPALAWRLSPALAVGLAVNVWDGTRQFDAVVDGEEIWWRTDYEGLNATAGVVWQRPGSPLRFGAMARSSFTMGLDYDDRFGDVRSSWSYDVQMPWMAGVGVAWEATGRLTVTAEIERRWFGDREIVASGAGGEERYPLSASGQDLTPVRVGLEYRAKMGSWQVPLRAGYRTVPTLRADVVDGTPTDRVDGDAVTAGIGLRRGPVRLDLAYSRSEYERERSTGGTVSRSEQRYETTVVALTYTF